MKVDKGSLLYKVCIPMSLIIDTSGQKLCRVFIKPLYTVICLYLRLGPKKEVRGEGRCGPESLTQCVF